MSIVYRLRLGFPFWAFSFLVFPLSPLVGIINPRFSTYEYIELSVEVLTSLCHHHNCSYYLQRATETNNSLCPFYLLHFLTIFQSLQALITF